MNADPENDFEALRKLLTLKRHEQPPPGYFDRLPQKIMARLETEAAPSLWEKLVPAFSFKPAYAYAFGLAVCGSLVLGITYSLKTPDQTATAPVPDDSWKLAGHGPSLARPETRALTLKPLEPADLANTNSRVNPDKPRSLFDGLHLNAQPASYQSGN